MAFNWNDYQEVPASAPAPAAKSAAPAVASPSAFNWDDHPVVGQSSASPAEAPSAAEALLRGGAQGATMGFSDELQGGGQALFDKVLGNDGGKSLGDLYSQHTDEARAANAAAQAAHPYLYGAGNVAGGVGSGILTGGLGAETALGRVAVGAGMGAASGVGYGNAQDVNSGASDALKGALLGGVVGGAVEGVSSALSPTNLESAAEKLATNATGATGAQMQKFQPGAGRALLDRGIVGFGDSQANIAAKAGQALSKSGKDIQDSLSLLDNQGAAPVTRDDILGYIKGKIAAMSNSPSQASTVKQLEGIAQDIENGPEEYSLQGAELEKRGFDDKVNWKTPESNPANVEARNAYSGAVEDAATSADPELGQQFLKGKEDYHLLKPIQEAAERRAAVTQQSPLGGLLDMGSAAGAVMSGHPLMAPAVAVARRLVAPRLASSAAVTLDTAAGGINAGANKLADIVQSNPKLLGSWAPMLQAAATRGNTSLAATNLILSQTSQAYREHMKNLFDNQGNGK